MNNKRICKFCNVEKEYIFVGLNTQKRSRYKDEFNRVWSGRTCADCFAINSCSVKANQGLKVNKYRYEKLKYKNDPLYRLRKKFTSILNTLIYRDLKTSIYLIHIGCSAVEFKTHISNQFTEDMNFNNKGSVWSLDHIIPQGSAKTIDEIYKLNHYTNIRPLLTKQNNLKGSKLLKS